MTFKMQLKLIQIKHSMHTPRDKVCVCLEFSSTDFPWCVLLTFACEITILNRYCVTINEFSR